MRFYAIFIGILLSSLSVFARDNEVACQVKVNLIPRYDLILASAESSKITLGDFDGYRVMLNHTVGQKFSLEIFDGADEQRTYSDTILNNIGDQVTSTLWKRDILLEVSCQLHK